MPWTDLGTKDRWLLVTAALQAMATIGTFLVAVVGFWKVTPIITYQVQQQQQQEARAEQAASGAAPASVTERFSAEVVGWWSAEVTSLQRILDLPRGTAAGDRNVRYERRAAGGSLSFHGLRVAANEMLSQPAFQGEFTGRYTGKSEAIAGCFAQLDREVCRHCTARIFRECASVPYVASDATGTAARPAGEGGEAGGGVRG